MTLPVAILAGGLATRLRPVTEKIPKALVEVAGKPFIEHQLEILKENGVKKAVLCVGYLGEMLQEAVGDGSRFGVEVLFSFDGPVLLGTGGSLRKALPLLGDAFLVLYGDSYLDCDYRAVEEAFLKSGRPALMTVFHNKGLWDKSNILFGDGRVIRYDKKSDSPAMEYIDYGLSALKSSALAGIPAGEAFDLADLYRDIVDKGEMAGYEVTRRFYEIGSHEGLEETRKLLEKSLR